MAFTHPARSSRSRCSSSVGSVRRCRDDFDARICQESRLSRRPSRSGRPRAMDALVKSMGMSGISKSQVSRLCGEFHEKINAFRERPIEGSVDRRDLRLRVETPARTPPAPPRPRPCRRVPRLQERREVASFAQHRQAQRNRAGARLPYAIAVAVALVRPLGGSAFAARRRPSTPSSISRWHTNWIISGSTSSPERFSTSWASVMLMLVIGVFLGELKVCKPNPTEETMLTASFDPRALTRARELLVPPSGTSVWQLCRSPDDLSGCRPAPRPSAGPRPVAKVGRAMPY
jgi:hypothetical protein